MLLWTTHGLGSVSEAAIGFTSWLGPSTTPTDVDSAIRSASGRAFTTIAATAMVLDHDPSIMRTGIEIREVSDYDDFAAGATHRGPSRGPPRERS
jgi:hypothetical protein